MKKKKILLALVCSLCLTAVAYALNPPTALNASFDTKNKSVLISWNGVDGAAGYNVYRKNSASADYTKINPNPVSGKSYQDASFVRGRDYLYAVRAVDAQGTESEDSAGAGAPLMSIGIRALVDTNRSKPVEKRSIKSGKLVTFAGVGDMITYTINYVNQGCSSAKNASINFEIPKGTVIAGNPVVKSGSGIYTYYLDRKTGSWVSKVENENNISQVRIMLREPIPPVSEGNVSGAVNIKVIITL
jgi:uncharacterized repeat protein (TIGR01451 family)